MNEQDFLEDLTRPSGKFPDISQKTIPIWNIVNANSIKTAFDVAKEKGLNPHAAARAQANFNGLQYQKFWVDLATVDFFGLPVPTKALYAATKGDIDRKYGQAYNILQTALGNADEIGRLTDRNKAFTDPKINPTTGFLEFDPAGEALVRAGFEKSQLSPEAQDAKWAELSQTRAANKQLADLFNSGQIPQDFVRLGKTPMETAQLFANAQGAAAINTFMGKQAEETRRQKEGAEFTNDPSLSAAQQVANTLAQRGQPGITEADTSTQSPLLAQPLRAQAENLSQAQNRTQQGIQNANKGPPAPTPSKARQEIAVTASGATPLPTNFTPAPNFSLAAPDELERLKKRLGK